MFCTKCGSKLPDDAVVCPNCGAKVEKDISVSDIKDYAGQKAQQVSSEIQTQVNRFKQFQDEIPKFRRIRELKDMFVSPDEKEQAVIGQGWLRSMLQSGILGNGFGVLTDRRLYFRGKSYSKVSGQFVKTDEDCVIDIRDITSSGFTYARRLSWLLLMVASLVIAIFIFVGAIEDNSVQEFLFVDLMFFATAVAFLALYIWAKRVMYTVTFGGGSLSILASSYGVADVRDFDKVLHILKDNLLLEGN